MEIWIHYLIIIACILGLWFGSNLLVEGATRIARKVGMSELIIGLTIVAMGTSAPEFAVTISSAVAGSDEIAASNIIGSNIFNLGFILGGVVLFRAIATNRKIVYRDGGMLLGTSIALMIFFYDKQLVLWEAITLFSALVLYIGYLIMQREPIDEDLPEGEFHWTDIIRLLVGISIIATAGHFLAPSARAIAVSFGLSEWLIGMTVVAAATSAPEMATSFTAAVKGHESLSIGNLIGSDLFNTLGVLGLAGMIQAGRSDIMTISAGGYSDFILLALMVTLVVIMMRTGWILKRREGLLLIGINIGRWGYKFMQELGWIDQLF